MNTHQTPTTTIRYHRARPRNGQPHTLAIISTTGPGLVRWQRVVLPVGLQEIEHCQRVVDGLLRQLGAGG